MHTGMTRLTQARLYKSEVILYYSDQRDAKHGQKLSHQTSKDLTTWDPPVDDVAYADYKARPGMTTVALLPNGKYILTYEYGGGPGHSGYTFPVYYRIAEDPRAFDAAGPGAGARGQRRHSHEFTRT